MRGLQQPLIEIYFIFSLALGVCISWNPAHAAPIYVYTEKNGSIRFSSKPPTNGIEAKVFTARNASYSLYRGLGYNIDSLFRHHFDLEIQQAAKKFEVAESLVRAVIHVESGFQLRAVSPKGARGLMQLMPGTAKLLGVKNSFDPHENVHGGTYYLATLLKRFKGSIRYALAGYNAGPEAVVRYGGVPPYAETQAYVKRVIEFERRYRLALREEQLNGVRKVAP